MTRAAELANLIGNINMGGGGANRNVIINGAMNVAQRGISSTGLGGTDGYFTCDRWRHVFNTSGRLTSTQDSSAPSGFANSLKFACTTADTSIASGEYLFLSQRIEGQNAQSFAKGTSDAKPFAVSFYVKGNASATYVAELFDGDNSRSINKSFNVTTDWTRVELSFPADTTGTLDDDNASSLVFSIWLHAGSTYSSGTLNSSAWASNTNANRAVGISSFFDSTARTFFITGVQVEVGQNPTSFEHEPFEKTLRKCQRYYQDVYYNYEGAFGATGNGRPHHAILQVPMRASQTFTNNEISKGNDVSGLNAIAAYNTEGESNSIPRFAHAQVGLDFSGSSYGYYYTKISADAEL